MHDLKTRIRAEIMRNEYNVSLRKVAAACGVSKSSVAAWSVPTEVCKSSARRGPAGHHDRIKGAVLDAITCQPLSSARQIAEHVNAATGLLVSQTTIYKSLKRLNMSYKIASRCRKHQELDRRHPFFSSDPFADDAMAFDEAGFYVNAVPSRGWGRKGERVPKAAIARSARLSLLLVTDRRGIVASRLLRGGVKAAHIADFVRSLPSGRPMILDNAAVHRAQSVRQACQEAGIAMRFLPPYSPWYNPVENAFAQAKTNFRRRRLVPSEFTADIERSVASVHNFAGMFKAAHRMWAHDAGSGS